MRTPPEIDSFRKVLQQLEARLMHRWQITTVFDNGANRWYARRKVTAASVYPCWRIYISCPVKHITAAVKKLFSQPHPAITAFYLPATLIDAMQITRSIGVPMQLGRQFILEVTDDKQVSDLLSQLTRSLEYKKSSPLMAQFCCPANPRLAADFIIRKVEKVNQQGFHNTWYITGKPSRRISRQWLIPALPIPTATDVILQLSNGGVVPVKNVSPPGRSNAFICLHIGTSELLFIKMAWRGENADYKGYDGIDRLTNEYRFLKKLWGSGFTPQPHFLRRDQSFALLCTSYISGVPLGTLPFHEQVALFPELLNIVKLYSRRQIAHRDLNPSNIIVNNKKLFLIDWEISTVIGNKRIIPGGTIGYIPPEGSLAEINDHYALVACFSSVLLQGNLLNIPVANSPEIIRELLLLEFPPPLARLLYSLFMQRERTLPLFTKRLQSLIKMAAQREFLSQQAWQRLYKAEKTIRQQAQQLVIDAMKAMSAFEVWHSAGLSWTNNSLNKGKECAGLSSGAAGIIWSIWYCNQLLQQPVLEEKMEAGVNQLSKAFNFHRLNGFRDGKAGVIYVFTDIGRQSKHHSHLLIEAKKLLLTIKPLPKKVSFDEGICGILLAAASVYAATGDRQVKKYCRHFASIIHKTKVSSTEKDDPINIRQWNVLYCRCLISFVEGADHRSFVTALEEMLTHHFNTDPTHTSQQEIQLCYELFLLQEVVNSTCSIDPLWIEKKLINNISLFNLWGNRPVFVRYLQIIQYIRQQYSLDKARILPLKIFRFLQLLRQPHQELQVLYNNDNYSVSPDWDHGMAGIVAQVARLSR